MKFGRNDAAIAGGTLALFAAAFAVYWPALHGGFIWDDRLNIDGQPLIRSTRGLLDIWLGRGRAYDYYPLTWTTWWLEWRAWARNTLGYHVLNVTLHAASAAMLWRVLWRLRVPGAFVAAMIFTVHPVNVESVAWISERKNTLSMLMLAISLALYLDARREDQPKPRGFYWGSVIFFSLGLLAKPSAVLVPVVLLLLAYWQHGRVSRADWRASMPFFAVSAVVSAVTLLIHYSRGIGSTVVRPEGFASRLAGSGWCVWFYLDKLLRPLDLSFIYSRWHVDPTLPRHWIPLAALLGAFALCFAMRKWVGRGPLVALACYVAMLFPVLGFFDVFFFRYSLVADHWQYHACLVVLAPVVAFVAVALRRLGAAGRVLGISAACAAVAWLGVRAWHESHQYVDETTLWRITAQRNPDSAMALSNYAATSLWPTGHRDEARAAYLRAIELDPNLSEPYVSLGGTYLKEGNTREAINWFRRALATPPGGTDPRVRLADVYLSLGDAPAAIDWYEQALARAPDDGQIYAVLPSLYENAGDVARATELFRAHARLYPDDVGVNFVLGLALLRHGSPEEAKEALATARELATGDYVELNSMGLRLLTVGQYDASADMLREAIRVKPDYGPAYENLGKALEGAGRLDEAIQAFQSALRLQPGYRGAAENLKRARAAKARAGG